MKNLLKTSILLITCLFVTSSFPQTPSSPHSPNNPLPQWVIDNARKRGEFERRTQPPAANDPVVVSRRTPRRRADGDGPTAAETTEMLRPPLTYLTIYTEFLKDKDHGIFRIFPDRGCDKGFTVTVESLEKCAGVIPVKGGGSLFSFRLRKNDSRAPDFWDVHFIDGNIVGGNDSVQVIFAETDSTDIEAVTRKNAIFESLSGYQPKSTKTEIKKQNEDLQKGIDFEGKNLTNRIQPASGNVFAARIVAYFEKGPVTFYADGRGLDLTVAFQIVGTEPDGSLVILWKELKRNLPRKKLSE